MKREHFVVGSSASLLLSLLVPTVSEPIMAQTKPPIETVIPTVPFCDMVKTPAKYFDKTVRITAEISLTGDSGQYLNDAACPLHRDDAIGVGVPSEEDLNNSNYHETLLELSKAKYSGHAILQVVGILRDAPVRGFSWYRYRFDIVHAESLKPRIELYEGDLVAGNTYRATVQADKDSGLVLVPPLRMILHQAVRVEWDNLLSYPELKATRKKPLLEQEITFLVVSSKVKRVTPTRWNKTIHCKIL